MCVCNCSYTDSARLCTYPLGLGRREALEHVVMVVQVLAVKDCVIIRHERKSRCYLFEKVLKKVVAKSLLVYELISV